MKWSNRQDFHGWPDYTKYTKQSLLESNLKQFLRGDISLKLFRIRTRVNGKYHKDGTYGEDMRGWLSKVDEICVIK